MRRLKSLFRRALGIRLLVARARWFLLLGRAERACKDLEQVLTLSPSSFRNHFLLGRVRLLLGERAEAIKEFAICHCLDPERFSRQLLPRTIRLQVESGACHIPELPVFDMPPGEGGPLPEEWDDFLKEEAELLVEDPRLDGTDFVDSEEYDRLMELPAISSEDLHHVDLDALMTRLLWDPHALGP